MSAVLAEADSHGAWLKPMFDVAFDAPSGIVRLRQLILSLAMQGKLVPQLATEAPASDLVKRIAAEKAALVKAGELRAPKLLEPIADSNKPHAIPASWEWVRLGDIGKIFNGNSINASEKALKYVGKKGLPYIATKDVGYGLDALDYENGVSIPESESQFKIAHAGAVLICAEGGSAGKKCGVTDRDVCFGNKLFANELYGGIPPLFVLYVYLSPFFAVEFSREITGIIGGVSIARFSEIAVPLPPLEEQKRIVARIEELMSRCDELESLRLAQESKRRGASAAAVRQWLAGDDAAAALLGEHFASLISTREDVAELRKAILRLAVMGKLVAQDPADVPASELLKQIRRSKTALVRAGEIRVPKPFAPIADSEKPYAIPENWEWVRLGEVGAFERGRSKHRPRNDKRLFENGTIPFVQTGDVSRSKLTRYQIGTCTGYYSEFGLRQSRLWKKGTLCITIAANIAETGFLGMDACIPDSVVAFLSIDATISRLVKVFVDVAKDDLEHYAPSTAQKNINLEIINELVFPLPPIEEQSRIVARIDTLMQLCDALEQSIDGAQAKQAELLDAVMARA